ncbi:MAG: peptidoglycan editing factor PgeF [Candidatus Cloacimonetes bacterium]|nr:peptidoglycan editing factor PgeF [Candidatus Cloacimonadota bacterium]MCF7814061.1 peptidoglycan editing factor PgeF [Candidatus Cloacimonadota bacterium]MCF7868637.1 peptidoglycan editing factor PgeF [Candidatus Cloacimonadota bacterium]MCF7884092.1 peptidoglycan editing factor PgeF [Candidatus Cloacimonadota bacterium]
MKIIKKFGDKNFDLELLKNSDSIKIADLSIPTNRIILMEQVHSDRIEIIEENEFDDIQISKPITGVDGLITNVPDVFLAVKTADCIPILVWDETKNVIAALHSGRKGTELNIAEKAVQIFVNKFNSDPTDIRVEIGPAVCGKCYPVDQKTFDEFVSKTEVEQIFPKLDLKKVVKTKLQKAGILRENIFNHDICTKEDSSYFSFRENGTTGRQISVIGMV